jgi:hypothetical protein
MLSSPIFSLVIFAGVAVGLAWPLAMRLPLAAAEKLVASVGLSLLGIYLFAGCVYLWALPATTLWVLPALAVLGLAIGARPLAEVYRDADGRAVMIGQLLVTTWCIGWLATVVSYSGGGWVADWVEHWERARFFIEHLPLDHKFLGVYPLTARPPLANLVTAAFLALSRADFAHYQLFSTALASLVFLPAALLARRFGRSGIAVPVCALLFMVNPLFVENATFAWTKLPAAALTLMGLYFFLRAQEPGAPPAAALLCAMSLGAGLLAHYSAGPYVFLLAVGWLALGWPHRRAAEWRRATALAASAGALVLATWFGWALHTYGAQQTFFSNSSITAGAAYHGSQWLKILLNLRDTLVPHFLRPLDQALIAQRSPWGWWRDWFFQCYQLNLWLACGSIAWLTIIHELVRTSSAATRRDRIFWGTFVVGAIALGVATHGARDTWGLTHICLQALVLLGLAFLAARWSGLNRAWRLALLAGATVDLSLGIALHFGVQSYALDAWFARGQPALETLTSYSEMATMNLQGKVVNHLTFFAEGISPSWLAPMLLVLTLTTAIACARGTPASPKPRR